MEPTTASPAAVAGIGIGLFILYVLLSGLLVGALARWLLPGPDPMSWLATIGYGIAGSFLGGLVGRAIHVTGVLSLGLSVGGAALLIWFFRRRKSTK
jgi:uncharacterized membrane protein YeaQ/YmgE (transglycosylase-associated protein family)